jgi:hypothetical protein
VPSQVEGIELYAPASEEEQEETLTPTVVVGGIILVIGLLLAAAAPIPVVSVWVFNRRSSSGLGVKS